MYQAKTLRRLPPRTRALARSINALELETRRLKKMVEPMRQMENDQKALFRTMTVPKQVRGEIFPDDVDGVMNQQMLASATQNAPA